MLIELNDYQRINLIELIRAIGYPAGGPGLANSPLHPLDTGDWLGELYWLLKPDELHPSNRPNWAAETQVRWVIEKVRTLDP